MITPADIRKSALKYWNNQRFLRAELRGETLFPLPIPFRRMTSRQLLEQFESAKAWLQALRAGSKERLGYGYTVEYQQVNHRQLGQQLLPARIYIESSIDFLRLIDKQREYQCFQQLVKKILDAQPALQSWLEQKPKQVLAFHSKWPKLLEVCRYFQTNPRPDRYLRELDIPGVDSKFIERHKSILRELLDRLLPAQAIQKDITGLGRHGFERRYGLKYDAPLIRFRLLDPDHASGLPELTDISTPLHDFRKLSIPCERVFITENKINGLSFPAVKNSIVIFGLGYGIQSLQNIEWLREKEIFYWGDIDTHGFAILSQLRSYYPQTRSLLMDRQTLLTFQHLWGEEPADKRCGDEPPNLSDAELQLYRELRDNVPGENIRLEQERIEFGYVYNIFRSSFTP